VKRQSNGHEPTRFDALKVAARGEALAGEVEVRKLLRLRDRTVSDPDAGEARIRWDIAGGKNGKGHPRLTLGLEGQVFMTCQRCLRPLAMPIAQNTELLLARDESELVRLDAEEPEVVVATGPLDALTLVEDELLLSLPFSPRHEDGACKAAIAPDGASAHERPSAFAQLAGLKRRRPQE
jgi:uncharacterized protein